MTPPVRNRRITALAALCLALAAFLGTPFTWPAAARQQKKAGTAVHKPHRTKPKAAAAAKPAANKSVKVWVNTKTGVYHYPGTR